jgi:hypothetical protein
MKTLVQTVIILLLMMSCSSTEPLTEAQKLDLQSWGKEKAFIIESDWAKAMPSTALNAIGNTGILGLGNSAGSINLIGNVNYFKMKGDSISGFLPYFGERYVSGGYNNKIAIEFNDIPDRKKITFNEEKRRTEMRFRIHQEDDNEIYDIFIMVYSNNTARIDVNSSERSYITYEGNIKVLESQQN